MAMFLFILGTLLFCHTVLASRHSLSSFVPEPSISLTQGDEGLFLLFSDIHYDPFYGTPRATNPSNCSIGAPTPGQRNCDAPWSLVESSIAAAKKAYPNPDFIIFAGDLARHDMQKLGLDALPVMSSIIANVSSLFDSYFPNISRFGSPAVEAHASIVITLGNNDVVPGYNLDLNAPNATMNQTNPMLKLLADAWRHELSSDEYNNVALGGFYKREIVPGIHIFSINTLFYSTHHTPNTSFVTDPDAQFDWLKTQLFAVRAAGHRAYIVGHIPPVIDSCKFL